MSVSNNSTKWFIIYEDSTGHEQLITKNPENYIDAVTCLHHLKDRGLTILDTNVQ